MNQKFKEIGNYLIQIGLYLSTVNEDEFETRKQIKDNMINFLMQSYLYLQIYKKISTVEETKYDRKEDKNKDKDEYLSRKEVLEMYYPLFTEYGLNQSIHTKGLPYIRRGNKYFFKKSEINEWIRTNNEIDKVGVVKYV